MNKESSSVDHENTACPVWVPEAAGMFEQLVGRVPVFLQALARERVGAKAEALARADHRPQVSEKDLVDALFAETPFGFHGPMKSDMEAVGLDYTRYGYER